jgi:hypothetical protein
MSGSSTGDVTLHFVIAAGFAAWVTTDSIKRGKLAWGYAISSLFLLWWISLPFYFASRKLLPGESREGGFGWNVCKNFLLFWSFLLGYCMVVGIFRVSDHLSNRGSMSGAAEAGAAIGVGVGLGMFFCLWIGVAVPCLVIGLLIKKNTVVEKGEAISEPTITATSTPTTPAAPAPSQAVQISVARSGKTIGTFDPLTFRQKLTGGEILPTDHYWKQGMASWDLVSNYTG